MPLFQSLWGAIDEPASQAVTMAGFAVFSSFHLKVHFGKAAFMERAVRMTATLPGLKALFDRIIEPSVAAIIRLLNHGSNKADATKAVKLYFL